jgi:hypothetical protein
MSQINWRSAPEWANAVIKSKDDQAFYVSQFGGISARQRVGYSQVDNDASADMIHPHDWTLVETRHPAWSGAELPPIGVVCEISPPYRDHGTKVRVLCHDEGDAICRLIEGDELGDIRQFMAAEIRPARTAEQIAEEARQNAIGEMAEHMAGYKDVGEPNEKMVSLSTYLHDHGYRKQEAK